MRKNFLAEKGVGEAVQKHANKNFNGNWTKACNELLRAGLEAEKSGRKGNENKV